MPSWLNHEFAGKEFDRKSFLKLSTAFVAGVWINWAEGSPLSADSSIDPISTEANSRFALFSDTHIAMDPKDEYRGFKPSTNLEVVVQQACDQSFEMAFLNGDAARLDGQKEDYLQLKKLLQPLTDKCPVAIGLGNHDDREQFRAVFEPEGTPERTEAGRHITVVESQHARWILLDSLLYVNKTAGLLGKSQRAWLRKFLPTAGNKPTLIMVHHTLGDNDGELLDARDLLEIAKASPAVKAILYGHSHKYEFKRDGRLHLINLPAIGYNFSDNEPVGWTEAICLPNGIRLTLHAIAGDQSRNGETTTLIWDA